MDDERSGLPLLMIYSVLVIAGVLAAVGSITAFPAVGDVGFMVMLTAALIPTWPVAVQIEKRMALRAAKTPR